MAPRDSQRSRVWRAEAEVPHSPLAGLPACAAFVDRVVGSLWWAARFPAHTLGGVPRLRPGNGARSAFYREDGGPGPTITLPRRFRTKGVVLHELGHWALAGTGVADHGPTFARLMVDATAESCGGDRAAALLAAYERHRVRVGPAPTLAADRLVYGTEERARALA